MPFACYNVSLIIFKELFVVKLFLHLTKVTDWALQNNLTSSKIHDIDNDTNIIQNAYNIS